MNSNSGIPILTLLLFGLTTLPVGAQDRQDAYSTIADAKCMSAIHQVHSDIENRVGGAVAEVTYYDPSRQTTPTLCGGGA